MLNKQTETKWLWGTTAFLIVYCGFLLLFRVVLLRLEVQYGNILKPEPMQVAVIALVILFYHFTFLGLYGFSVLGKWPRIASVIVALLFTGSLLYGFRQWYTAVVNNPFLFNGQVGHLPWYAMEKTKFLIANTPLILYFIAVFVGRILLPAKVKLSNTDAIA